MNPFDVLERQQVGFLSGAVHFDAHRPTLVMVHGAGGSAELWLNQLGPLGRSLNAVALDLPGHRETPGPAAPSISGYAAWLRDVVESTFRGGVFLMGHSMGGAIILQAVLEGCRGIRGLILAGTGARLRVAPAFLAGLRGDFESTLKKIVVEAYAPGVPAAVLREGVLYMKGSGAAVVAGDFQACDGFDLREKVGQIGLPALVISGEADRLTPPKLSRELAALLGAAPECLIPGTGHMLMIENPAAFNAAVKHFLESAA